MRTRLGLVFAGIALSILPLQWIGCSSSKPAPGPPLDVVLGAGQTRAGKVTRQSELIGGPVAYGRVGDVWKLYNKSARFLIQDVGTSVGLDIYGGNLIDADLVREGDNGTNGNDLFRETFPIVGLRVQNPTRIDVISDGTHGGAAQLRVTGSDAPSDIIPEIDSIGRALGGTILTDYILDPDVPYLKIVTTYQNAPGQSQDDLLFGDFLSFGASLTLIAPETGFTGSSGSVSFYGSVGAGTSYGYAYADGTFQTPVVDASGTVTLLTSKQVPQDQSAQVTRYLVVGDGSAASVMGTMYGLRGITTAPLSGTVRDGGGAPVAGARVTIFKAPYSDTENAIDQATSHADGSYSLAEPPGDYVVIATGIGRLRGMPTPVSLVTGSTATQDVIVGAAGQATLDIGEVVNGTRSPVPAKVSFLSTSVEAPDPRFGPDPTETERNGVDAVALSPSGGGTVAVKPGTYNVVVSRGVEYETVNLTGVVVPPGGSVPIQATLLRSVDTTGWISGDYHQHSQGSIDSPVPIIQRVTEDLAEGVEFPAGTDHDNIIDFRPYIASLHGQTWMNAIPGDEVSVNGIGHFNAYPLTVDPADPYAKIGAKLWATISVPAFTQKLRQLEPQDIIVHVSHPRTTSLAGYFSTIHFDPTTGTSDVPFSEFDALEVNGDLGEPADYLPANDATLHQQAQTARPNIETMHDWFALLNQGQTVCALGNSDTHQRNGGTGYPRNFVHLNLDDPQKATGALLVSAIHGQQVSVSYGPFVTVTMNGKAAMGKGQVVNLAGAGSGLLGVRVAAPSWVQVSSLEVYENGRPMYLVKTGPSAFAESTAAVGALTGTITADDMPGPPNVSVRFDGTVKVTPQKDAWYVVVIRGGGTMEPVAGGTPYAYTNPVYVDTTGDGWTAPGL